MNEPAFVIKHAVGALLWSPGKAAGEFTALELSEVVMNTRPALELLRSVGSDGFSMLFTLAASASLDESSQLVVVGGVERLRSLMNWKRDKAQRVFRELLEAGYVARSQGTTIGNDGRRHFVSTVLVLHPHLYQPSATGSSGSGTSGDQTVSPATVVTGAGSSGTGGWLTSPAAGDPGSGDVSPARTAGGSAGTGDVSGTHDMDDDEKEHSSSSRAAPLVAGGEGGDSNGSTADDASLVTALRALGFADAERVVAQTDRTVLVESMQYVLTSTASIGNPGAYLRRLLRSGGVRKPDREQLTLTLASTLQSVRVAPTSPPSSPGARKTGDGSGADSSESSAMSKDNDGFDPELLDAYLAGLSDEDRTTIEHEADRELATVPAKFRRHATVFAAMRRFQLAKIAGLVDDD